MINVVTSFIDDIKDNAIWCASFQLAFNELQYKVLDNDFTYSQNLEEVLHLLDKQNRDYFVNDDDCFAVSGFATPQLKTTIENAIKTKFNESSDILDQFNFEYPTDNIFVYAMIKKIMSFAKEFEAQGKFLFGDSGLVYFFGSDKQEMLQQVKPTFYYDKNNYAVEIQASNDNTIILYRTDKPMNFEQAYNEYLKNAQQFTDKVIVNKFRAPLLDVDILHDFTNLKGQTFVRNKDGLPLSIYKALQSIKFNLNKSGAMLKSEAGIMMKVTSAHIELPPEYKNFIFDNTFYLFCIDNSKKTDSKPYLAIRVQDIKDFQK